MAMATAIATAMASASLIFSFFFEAHILVVLDPLCSKKKIPVSILAFIDPIL